MPIRRGVLEEICCRTQGTQHFLDADASASRKLLLDSLDVNLLADRGDNFTRGIGERVHRHQMAVLKEQSDRRADLRFCNVNLRQFHGLISKPSQTALLDIRWTLAIQFSISH
jgi:hypothetical protein